MVRSNLEPVLAKMIDFGLPLQQLLLTLRIIPGQPFSEVLLHQVETDLLLNGRQSAVVNFFFAITDQKNNDLLAWLMIAADINGNEPLLGFIENQLTDVKDQVEAARIRKIYTGNIDRIRNLTTELSTKTAVSFGGDWPTVDAETFYEREECSKLVNHLQTLLTGPPGALVVHGTGGIGKTTMTIFTMRKKLDRQLSSRRFGFVQHVIWLNVYEVSSCDTFDELSFVAQLRQVLLKNKLITADVTLDRDSIKVGLSEKPEKLLLVLDDVFNVGVLRCVSYLGLTVWALALTRSRLKAAVNYHWFHSASYEMPYMSPEGIERILVDRYKLPEKIRGNKERRLPKLVNICLGLPLIAAVIHANFKGKVTDDEIEQTYLSLVRNCDMLAQTKIDKIDVDKKGNSQNAQTTVSTLLSLSMELEKLAENLLKPFLLFEPGQTVSSVDLQLIWAMQNDAEVQRLYEYAVELSVLKRTADGGYILHDLLHKAVEKLMAKQKDSKYLRDLQQMIILECLQRKRNQNVLVTAILLNRQYLVNRIVELGDPKLLAALSVEKNFEVLHTLLDKVLAGELWPKFVGRANETSDVMEMLCRLIEHALTFSRSVFEDPVFVDKMCRTFADGRKWYENVLFVALKLRLASFVDCLLQNQRTAELSQQFVDFNGDTALIFTCKVRGDWAAIEKLAPIINANKQNKRGETALWHCPKWSDALKMVRAMVSKTNEQIDVNICDRMFGNTALHQAVQFDKFDLVKYLVEKQSADINLANKINNANATEFALAIRRQREIGEWLLNRPGCVVSGSRRQQAIEFYPDLKSKIEATSAINSAANFVKPADDLPSFDDGEFTPLHSAAFHNNLEKINQLKNDNEASFAVMMKTYDELGRTPLLYSCFDGHQDIVQFLLQNEAQQIVNNKDEDGGTALMIASQNGHADIVRLLIDHGANLDLQNNDGSTALTFASENGHADIVRLLIDHGANLDFQTNAGSTALIFASQNGHADIVRLLIDHGANVDLPSNDGSTALTFASKNGHADIARLLIDHGANFDLQNNVGSTALTFASGKGHADIVRLLIDNGANLDLQNNAGWTALTFASGNGHADIVRLLIDHGANLDLQNNAGETALTHASYKGWTKIVHLLIDNAANLNHQNTTGETPLFYACDEGHEEVVGILIAGGANLDLQTNAGATALFMASLKGYLKIVHLLLANGANKQLICKNGDSCYSAAIRNGHYRIALALKFPKFF